MKDAAQDVAEDVLRMWRRILPSRPGRRAPSLPRHHHRRRRRLCAARAEMGGAIGQLSGIWPVAFGSGCEQTLPEVPRKAPLYLCKGFGSGSRMRSDVKNVVAATADKRAAAQQMNIADGEE